MAKSEKAVIRRLEFTLPMMDDSPWSLRISTDQSRVRFGMHYKGKEYPNHEASMSSEDFEAMVDEIKDMLP